MTTQDTSRREPEDPTTTHALAGEVGRHLADSLAEKVTEAIDGLPASTGEQRAAIARLIADTLYTYAEENAR